MGVSTVVFLCLHWSDCVKARLTSGILCHAHFGNMELWFNTNAL